MTRRSLVFLPRSAPILVLTWACAGQPTSATSPVASEAITITAGLQPTFDWIPGGTVHEVTVTRAGTDIILWSAISPNRSNTISPPVGYGTTPDGAINTANKIDPLATGVTYRVALSRYDERGVLESVGSGTFVP